VANVRLIVYNASTLSAEDTLLRDRLQGLGHTVSLQGTTVHPSPFPAASSWDLVVVARSSWYTEDLPASYLSVPQINLQRFSWTAMGFDTEPGVAGSPSATTYQTHDGSHPVASGKSGTVTVTSQGVGLRGFASPPASLHCVFRGGWSESTNSGGVHIVNESAALNGGKIAGARMAIFGFANTGSLTSATADWWTIFDGAVGWTLGSTAPTSLATPSGLSIANPSGRTITGSWSAVTDADHYEWRLQRQEQGDVVTSGTTAGLSFAVDETDGVQWDATYRFQVRAMPVGG
jgi:hypothetical protein